MTKKRAQYAVEVEAQPGPVNELKKKRVALYARVSTERQAEEGFGLKAQIDRLRAYAVSKGWEIAGEYVDGGYTGKDTKRPEYQRLLQEIDAWDVMVVLMMSRAHRNQRNFTAMMDLLVQEDRAFASVTESLDGSTAVGKFVMQLFQSLAVLESDQIGERVSYAFQRMIKEGRRNMGQAAAWGYRWSRVVDIKGLLVPWDDPKAVGDPMYGSGELLVREDRRALVIQVFDLWVAGKSAGAIAKEIGWCACKPKKVRKTWTLKDGTQHSKVYTVDPQDCSGCARVRYIYNNPVYCGYLYFMDDVIQGDHEPIVSRETFEAGQARRPKRRIPLPAVEA